MRQRPRIAWPRIDGIRTNADVGLGDGEIDIVRMQGTVQNRRG
jgi:hypothetical protein